MSDERDFRQYTTDDFENSAWVFINGARLRELRDSLGLTREKLAGLTSTQQKEAINPDTIRNMENHKDPQGRVVPKRTTLGMVYRLAKALKNKVGVLLAVAETTPVVVDKSSQRGDELLAAAQSFVSTAGEVIDDLPPGHPHLSFLAVHWDSMAAGIETSKSRQRVKSLIEADDYRSTLEKLTDEDRSGIRAIADLSDPTELSLWFSGESDPGKTWVKERIFWIDWESVFNRNVFPKISELLNKHSRFRPGEYNVRLGLSTDRFAGGLHPLGTNAVGKHLLLIEPTLVGGYEENTTTLNKLNVIWSERSVYEKATAYYRSIYERSLPWDINITEADSRQAIVRLGGVGIFEPSWGEHATRPPQYFDLYEANIRVWNPWYREMTELCCRHVQAEVLAKFNFRKPIRLLEVGVGTGGLTRPLLDWIIAANNLASCATHSGFVEKYFGIDSAQQMLDRIPDEIRRNDLCLFSLGRYGRGNIQRLTGDRKVDVIFGSLVLHDILDRDLTRNVPQFFEDARDCLTEGGTLVFADILFSSDNSVRVNEMECWKRRMSTLGMTDTQIATFLECNPEMVETATEESLNQTGTKHGFAPIEVHRISEPKEDFIPFKIIVMRQK